NLQRADFYEKELTFQVSCSYGPGRYDPAYEAQGHDYPFGFVRWTEQRNFEAVLQLIADGKLHVTSLISHRVPQTRAQEAYRLLTGASPSLGFLLPYPETTPALRRPIVMPDPPATRQPPPTTPVVGVIGAGQFTTGVLLPALAKTSAQRKAIASAGGLSAASAARKFGFPQASTAFHTLFVHPEGYLGFIYYRPNI